MTENEKPIISWFTQSADGPRLIGNRCKACGDYFFPRAAGCRNPNCMSEDMEEVLMGPKGKLWSYTENFYPPPAPYVAPDPFVPYTIVVVELEKEKLNVAGQLADGYAASDLKTGMDMELVIEPLYIDAEGQHTVWKWKPIGGNK